MNRQAEKVFGWYGKIPSAGDFVSRRIPRDLLEWWDRWMRGGMAGLRLQPGASQIFRAGQVWNFAIPASLGVPYVQVGSIAASHDRVGREYPVCAALRVPRTDYRPALLASSGEFYHGLGAALSGALAHRRGPDQLDDELLRAASSVVRHAGMPAAERPARKPTDTADRTPYLPSASLPPGPNQPGDDILAILNGPAGAPQPGAYPGSGDILDVLGTSGLATPETAPLPDLAAPPIMPTPVPAPTVTAGGHSANEGMPPGWPDLALYFDPDGRTSYWWTNQSAGQPLQTWLHGGGLNTALFCHLFAPTGAPRPLGLI
ncbi:MAG: type VI secretion system-associated protein TagF [Pigmentiphaga sp.]|uniref:type VI secretion system-associated protein TagF n=1 Tax=Pigmentiphaga sp. TaxID=1977564 RepID=UPI0029AA9823|nr:type VI secretion system-associated protein TagF [Pigmentiphaga sp.]MDX3905820.1 type VI secretion system-associated protein TagF [Pigmentiphaga sp.]